MTAADQAEVIAFGDSAQFEAWLEQNVDHQPASG